MLGALPLRRLPKKCRMLSTNAKILQIEESIQEAIAQGKPVVALESTIIAHGMPYPENLQLVKEVGTILRGKVCGSFNEL